MEQNYNYLNRKKSFYNDLENGNKYERWFGSLLSTTGISYNNDKRYDILYNGITYEIKSDKQTYTGNIAIEYSCNGKKSGIEATEADYMVFIFPLISEVWKIKTKKLKELISNTKNIKKVKGGDNKLASLYLFKREEVKENFKTMKINIPLY